MSKIKVQNCGIPASRDAVQYSPRSAGGTPSTRAHQLLRQLGTIIDADELPVLAADEQDVPETFSGDNVCFFESLVNSQSGSFRSVFAVEAAISTAIRAVVRQVKWGVHSDRAPESPDGKLVSCLRHLLDITLGSR